MAKAPDDQLPLIPQFDLGRQIALHKGAYRRAFDRVLEKQEFVGRGIVQEFETGFAQAIGAPYVIGVHSGTAALHLALKVLDLQPGSEVLVPVNTFIATPFAVHYAGGKPIFVDCDPDTWNISLDAIRSKITPATKGIVGVHLYGAPCEMDKIGALCKEKNLFFIQDAAQAHGAKYNGLPISKMGDIACYSFYPSKNLGAFGQGGCISCHSPIMAERLKSLRYYGMRGQTYDEIGHNYRMDDLQAALLLEKLTHLKTWTESRKAIARHYREQIRHPEIALQRVPENAESVYHHFVVRHSNREALRSHLLENKIGTGVHYPIPCHLHPAFKFLNLKKGDFPVAEQLSKEILSLPMFPELRKDEVDRVVQAINSFRP